MINNNNSNNNNDNNNNNRPLFQYYNNKIRYSIYKSVKINICILCYKYQ